VTAFDHLTPDQLQELIKGNGLRLDEGDSITLTLVNRRKGTVLGIRLDRAFQLQGVGAAGWWVALRLPGEQKFTSAATYASAEPMRGWALHTHRKLTSFAQPGDCATRLEIIGWLRAYWQKPFGMDDILRGCSASAVVRHERPWTLS